jgi:pyruvate,water dikinase
MPRTRVVFPPRYRTTSVKVLYWLDRVQPSDRPSIGEKAFSLSQFGQEGYLIPPGFVISGAFFREFIDNLRNNASILIDLPYSSLHLDVDNYQTLQQVAQQSRQEILGATLPAEWRSLIVTAAQQLQSPTLILRASLSLRVASQGQFSGLLPSQICWCEAEALELAIKQTWAQLFSAKSLFYWQRIGLGIEQIDFAILVQPISNAIASGTAEINFDRLQIQASCGLGQSLHRGDVFPDTYQIKLATGQIETQQLGNKIRAYRLKSEPASESDRDCLEAYLLTREEQERFCLDETSLMRLIQLAQRLAKEKQYRGSLKWTIAQASQLYITQINPNLVRQAPTVNFSSREPFMEDSQPLLTGLSASPGQVIGIAHAIADDVNLAAVPAGRILIARTINPNWLPWLKQATGLIAEAGGITSHAAIIARELRIPAIVNAIGAAQLLNTGESLLLDGTKGEVYRLKEESAIEEQERIKAKSAPLPSTLKNGGVQTPKSKDQRKIYEIAVPYYPIGTQLMVNLSQPSAIAQALTLPVDGVGLLRSEWMLSDLLSQKPLHEWLEKSQHSLLVEWLTRSIGEFASGFAPRPVFYRSVTGKAFEHLSFSSSQQGNKSIESRGTNGYQLDPTLFDLELQALSQISASGCTNVNLILPFVRSVEEFSFCRRRIEQAGLFQQSTFQLWIMAEVPSVIFLLPQFVRAGVQGISIGTNDLTQLLLGVDREQAMFSDSLNALHPAMLAAIEQLIRLAQTAGIPCSICGQAPVQYPELIDRLVQWGITSISVEPEAIESTYRAIARAEQRLLLKSARHQQHAD